MNTLVLETLALDFPEKEVVKTIRHIKGRLYGGGHWDGQWKQVLSEYGSYDDLVLAALLYCIEQTGTLSDYVNQTKNFITVLRSETRKLNSNFHLNAVSVEVQDEMLSDEQRVYNRNVTDPLIPNSQGVSYLEEKLEEILTEKQFEAVRTMAETRSRYMTGRILGLSPVAVKQLLQRARRVVAAVIPPIG